MTDTHGPVFLGLDPGSVRFRAAYAAGEERSIVAISLHPRELPGYFPVAVRISHRPHVPRFFPGLLQWGNEDQTLALGEHQLTGHQLLENVIAAAVDSARRFCGREIRGGAITYPVWADASVRMVLRKALAATGLAEVGVCSEIEAAAANVADEDRVRKQPSTTLVLSAGYTGFGVGVVRTTPNHLGVLAERGEQGVLAGNAADFALMRAAFEDMRRAGCTIVEPEDRRVVRHWATFRAAVEDAKHAFSDARPAEFVVPAAFTPGLPERRVRIVREVFREYVTTQIRQAERLVERTLADAGVELGELQRILLIGGSTFLPGFYEWVRHRFSATDVRHLPPEALASGAARQGVLEPDRRTILDPPVGAVRGGVQPAHDAIPGLCTLLDPPTRRDLEPSVDLAVEHLTLAGIRAEALAGNPTHARERLRLLRDAIDGELRMLADSPARTAEST